MNARFGRFSRAAGENHADYSDPPSAAWPTGVTVIDGVVYATAGGTVHNLTYGLSAAPGSVEVACSIEVRPPHSRWQELQAFFDDANWNRYAGFDLEAGTVAYEGPDGTGTIERLDDGGWRIGVVTTTPAVPGAGSYAVVQWGDPAAAVAPDPYPEFAGDGEALARLSGFQLEEGSTPSARIAGADTVAAEYGGALLVPGGTFFAANLDGAGSGDVVAVEVSFDGGATWATRLSPIPVAAPAVDLQVGATCLVRLACTTLATGPLIGYQLRRSSP